MEDIINSIMYFEASDMKQDCKIADSIMSGKPVVVRYDLKNSITKSRAQESLQFLTGVTYAIDGNPTRVKKNIFLFCSKQLLRDESIKKFIKEFNN